jgi:hypothetical protein
MIKSQGGKMTVELVGMLIFFAMFGMYGIYKYSTSETNAYNTIVEKARDNEAAMKALTTKVDELDTAVEEQADVIEAQKVLIATISSKFEGLEKDFAESQEHLAKLRKSQIDLRDRSYPRHIELSIKPPVGAIPVEIYGPTKKAELPPPLKGQKKPTDAQMKKLKKQIDEVSK